MLGVEDVCNIVETMIGVNHVSIYLPFYKAQIKVFGEAVCQHATPKCHRKSMLRCNGRNSLDDRQSSVECPHMLVL
jgi:hypothetical protein